ncbi:MAG TPA: BON domain-containing protein [Candidatus Angelobacter sp.]|nr:BON domain-containing protein [Candidatus Angelobacter sp.]
MSKTVLKNLVWLALPLGLAVGCASNRPAASEASYDATAAVLTPTSSEPESQIYVSSDAEMNTPPKGTSPQTWAIAQAIQQKLLSDPSLAPLGSTLVAKVSTDGDVTLTGNVASQSEQDRVRESISTLPGVRNVNDQQLAVGHFNGPSSLNTTSPQQ